MGLIVRADCLCGYTSEELSEGHGGESYDERRLGLCGRCREVVTVELQAPRCPRCKTEVTKTYGDENAHPELDRIHECPRCGECDLAFTPVGIWD
jgi:hypothetical protein